MTNGRSSLLPRYRVECSRPLSTAIAEALAAADHLDATIAVAHRDVGPGFQAAAGADNVRFRVISR